MNCFHLTNSIVHPVSSTYFSLQTDFLTCPLCLSVISTVGAFTRIITNSVQFTEYIKEDIYHIYVIVYTMMMQRAYVLEILSTNNNMYSI